MELHLTKVFKSDKDKEGKPLVGKYGPYTKIGIKCTEYGDRWISGFVKSWNENWKEGDTVNADVIVSGEYLNLREPDPIADLCKLYNKLEARVRVIEKALESEGFYGTNPSTK